MNYPRLRRLPAVAFALGLASASIIGGGVIAAQSLTVTVLAASGAAADLLPASTVLYADVNLNPSATQTANLRTIERAFAAQPGFKGLQDSFTAALTGAQGGQNCTNGARPFSWNAQVRSWINGTAAVAVTDAAALSGKQNSPAAQNGVVVLVGLKVQRSIADIVTNHQLGSASLATTFKNIPIYAIQSAPACGSTGSAGSGVHAVTGGSPAFAAVLNGYAVLGQTKKSIEREIDVFRGVRPALSQSASYQRLLGMVPRDRLAYLYMNTPALLREAAKAQSAGAKVPGAGSATGTLPADSKIYDAIGPMGMTVRARPNGFSVQLTSVNKAPALAASAVTPNDAIKTLPAGSLFYMSLDNLKALYKPVLAQLASGDTANSRDILAFERQYGDVINLLDGEVALSVLPTNMRAVAHLSDKSTSSLPLVLMVNVSKHPNALATVQSALASAGANGGSMQFTPSVTAHGNTVYAASGGYGYAQIKHWLIVSTSIRGVAASMEGVLYGHKPNVASGHSYADISKAIAGRNTSVAMINLQALRIGLEQLLPANANSQDRRQYAMVRPLLVPLRALSISSPASPNRNISRVNVFLAISH